MLEKSLNIFREERVDELMKEQARLKAEISAVKLVVAEPDEPVKKQEEGTIL